MQNTIFNTICRAVLIGSMLLAPTALKADPPYVSDTEHESEQQSLDRIDSGDLDPCVYEFWNVAWDLDFVLGQSGMLLEGSGTEAWQVLVTDTGAEDYVVAEGSFTEADRLLLESMAPTQEELDEAGIISFDHYIVAGVITGSTVFQSAVFGFAMEVVVPGLEPEDDPIVSHGFTPLALADDVASAVAMAYDYWIASEFPDIFLDATGHVMYPSDSHGSTSGGRATDRDCEAEYKLCMSAAFDRAKADREEVIGDAILRVVACPIVCIATGPAYLFCLAGCEAAVLVNEALELDAINKRYDADCKDCLREALACDGSST